MSQGNPYQGLEFDVAIKEFLEDCKKKLRLNYSIGNNTMGGWFEGQDPVKKPIGLEIQLIAEDLFAHHGMSKDWVTMWIHAMKVASSKGTIDDVIPIIDDWEKYYRNERVS